MISGGGIQVALVSMLISILLSQHTQSVLPHRQASLIIAAAVFEARNNLTVEDTVDTNHFNDADRTNAFKGAIQVEAISTGVAWVSETFVLVDANLFMFVDFLKDKASSALTMVSTLK